MQGKLLLLGLIGAIGLQGFVLAATPDLPKAPELPKVPDMPKADVPRAGDTMRETRERADTTRGQATDKSKTDELGRERTDTTRRQETERTRTDSTSRQEVRQPDRSRSITSQPKNAVKDSQNAVRGMLPGK
jgi:hypothetical protein